MDTDAPGPPGPPSEPGTAELRVLSHPTRLAFLRRLRAYGPATARALGREFGMDSGAASYHLRRLAAGGLIQEDPDRGTRRERWWRAGNDVVQFDPAQHEDEASRAYVHANLLATAADLKALAGSAAAAPAEWLAASAFVDHRLDLDDRDAEALRGEILALVERYRDRPPASGGDFVRPPVVVQVQLYRRP